MAEGCSFSCDGQAEVTRRAWDWFSGSVVWLDRSETGLLHEAQCMKKRLSQLSAQAMHAEISSLIGVSLVYLIKSNPLVSMYVEAKKTEAMGHYAIMASILVIMASQWVTE